MLRDAACNARFSRTLHSRTAGRHVSTRHLCVARVVCVITLILLSLLVCVTSGRDTHAAPPSSPVIADNADVVPSLKAALRSDSQVVSDAVDDLPLSGSEVALQYTFRSGNLVFVLSENGFLHAYHLESGTLAWSADVGGDMVAVEVDLPPSRETILRDPLALPFLVRGNSLFTRTPFYTYNPGLSSTLDTAELLSNLPDPLRPYFFMNISTLLRRQTVFFGGTDVFVTTSVEVADLDSSNGHHVTRQQRGGRARGGSSKWQSRRTSKRDLLTTRDSTASPSSSSSSLFFPSPQSDRRRTTHNELLPLLHVVRYNIVLHVVKAGEYSWSITLSQLQLSPRASFSDMYRRATEARTSSPSAATTAEAKEHNAEGNPRFFSHVMQELLDYDAAHAEKRGDELVPEKIKTSAATAAASLNSDPSVEKKTGIAPATATLALVEALQRRRTEVADYVRRVLTMQQFNRSHIRLRNVLEDTTTWTATLPSSRRNTHDFRFAGDGPADRDTEHHGDGSGEEEEEVVEEMADAAPLQSSLASTHAIASYVWVSGSEQIFRIPMQRAADLSATVDDDDDDSTAAGAATEHGYRSRGEEDDKAGIYVESVPGASLSDKTQRLRLTASTFAGAVVPTQGTLGGLQLVPFLHRGGVVADMSHTVMALDVEGDEREGEELDRYYRDPRWWESTLLGSGSPNNAAAAAQNLDNPFATFSSTGDGMRTGLAWRTAGIISFHVLCLAGSMAFLCAGVPPRNQLQRAWAQADRNRDRLSHTSVSRPQSTQLMPQDLLRNAAGGTLGGFNGTSSPFSPVIDGFSVDSPAQTAVEAMVMMQQRSVSPARLDSSSSDDKERDPVKSVGVKKDEGVAEHASASAPPHKWDDRTPEEVYAMMREESEEKILSFTGTGSSATASALDGKGLTSSHTTQHSRHSPTDCDPSTAMRNGEGRLIRLPRGQQRLPSSSSTSATNDEVGTDDHDPQHEDGEKTLDEEKSDDNNGHHNRRSSSSSSDDDSEEIDMGERWWVRAQHRPRLPSVATLDETLSDKGSSVSFSAAHHSSHRHTDGGSVSAVGGDEEEGKLFQLHFKVLEKIGFGGEGCVFCVEHRVTHARYAIKAILIHEQDEERVVQEAVLHSSFDHANVVRFYFCWIEDIAVSTADRLQLCNVGEDGLDTMSMGFSNRSLPMSSPTDETFTDDDRDESMVGDTYHMLFIQMEYFSRGTLADWLRSRKGFYRLEVLRYMQNIADGLAYLHNQDVVHRDLKPTNIFVSNANVLKIGDFGLAKRRIATTNSNGDLASNVVGQQQERSVVGGSPLYCSPEQTRGDPVNKPSDIFSFGIIAVEMLCTFATLHERIRILTDAHQGVLPAEIERDFAEEVQIIRPLLSSEPQQRPALRKVQRQLMRLIDTLEDSEQDGDDVPHSPAETIEPSRLAAPISSAQVTKSILAATPAVTAGGAATTSTGTTTTYVPVSRQTSGSTSVTTVGVFTGNTSPLLRTSTAASFSTGVGAAGARKPVTADIVPLPIAAGTTTATTAPTTGASSPLCETPSLTPRPCPAETNDAGRTAHDARDAEAQPLPAWQSADAMHDDAAAVSASSSPSYSSASPHTGQPRSPLPHLTRRSSASSTHSASTTRHRNSYHDRRYASLSSTPGAETSAAAAAAGMANGGVSSPETGSQAGASTASPADFIVTDPYGPPTTPVTYAGDADLSSILKRDLQDRTISPPD